MEESIRILKPYFRGLPLILIAMMAGYLAASQYLKYVTPMYESAARLRLADLSEGVPNSNLFKDFDVFATSSKIAAEIELIKSELIINKALDRLDFDIETYRVGKLRTTELYHDAPFFIEITEMPASQYDRLFDLYLEGDLTFTLVHPDGSTLKGTLGDTLEWKGAAFVIRENETVIHSRNGAHIADHYQFKKLSRSKLVAQVKQNLTVLSVDKEVAVLRIIFSAPHAVKASRFPDVMARTYIDDYIASKYNAAHITVNFLDQQIREVSQKLTRIEQEIEAYRNQRGVTNLRQETETILREVSQMKIQQSNLRMNLEAINELHGYIQAGREQFEDLAPNFEAFTDLLSTELVKKIKELRAERRDLLLTFTPEEERVQVIDGKLDDIFNYFVESISNTRRNLTIKYQNLSRDIKISELQLVDVPEKERQMVILNREFSIYQESYNFLNEKKIEAEIAQAATIAFHRIIEHARVPDSPFSPNYIILKIVAAMLGGGLVIGFIFLVHTIKARVNDLVTIQTNSSIPVTASTPRLRSVPELQHHFLHQVNQLEIKKILSKGSILGITAFRHIEGGAFHALHLAEALSRQGHRVLLVDAENCFGMVACPAGEVQQVTPSLSVVHFDDPAFGFYTTERMGGMAREMAAGFDITIIANAEIGTQLSLQLMTAASVNLVVVDTRLTPARYIPRIDLMKDEYKLDQVYFVLNRIGYNPNIVLEAARWLLDKLGLRGINFDRLTYA